MNGKTQSRAFAMVVGLGVLSILAGLIIGWLQPEWAIAGIAAAAAVGLVLYDYRVGVVCLTLLFPWAISPLIPQTYGFNLINFLLVASVISMAIPKFLRKESFVPLPRVVPWCYLLPIALAVLVAWPHLPEGSANYPPTPMYPVDTFAPVDYLKGMVIKPMFYVVYAFLVANAVRDTKRPELFLVAFGLSAALPAVGIIGSTLAGGSVFDRGTFLSSWGGLHPNSYAQLLALAAGPLLFICFGSGPRLARLASGAAFAIASAALLFTGSRGGAMALIVILGVFVIRRRKVADLIFGLAVAVVLVFLMPEQVQHRLTLGLEDTMPGNFQPDDGALTSGRLWIFETLAPDIWLSPVWGRGLNSIAWHSAVTAGRIVIGHPHNMYLAVLLDLGLLGFAAIMYVYYRYGRTFRTLSREASLSPIVRDYFAGAFASFLGLLAYGLGNGDYMPRAEQTYLWFSLGFAFAYWHLGQRLGSPEIRKPFGLGVKRAPVAPARPLQGR